MGNSTFIFIDGHYLDLVIRELSVQKVDYYKLSKELAKEQKLWWEKTYYYFAPPYQGDPPTKEEADRRAKYDRYISIIKKLKNFVVREGRCQKLPDGYHEKGVDTLITIDLMDTSFHNEIKNIILITADTDFVPIIKRLSEKQINTILYYYSDRIRNSKFSLSNELIEACHKSILISKDILEKARLTPKTKN